MRDAILSRPSPAEALTPQFPARHFDLRPKNRDTHQIWASTIRNPEGHRIFQRGCSMHAKRLSRSSLAGFLSLSLFALLLAMGSAYGQGTSGAIDVTVTDASGSVVPGA